MNKNYYDLGEKRKVKSSVEFSWEEPENNGQINKEKYRNNQEEAEYDFFGAKSKNEPIKRDMYNGESLAKKRTLKTEKTKRKEPDYITILNTNDTYWLDENKESGKTRKSKTIKNGKKEINKKKKIKGKTLKLYKKLEVTQKELENKQLTPFKRFSRENKVSIIETKINNQLDKLEKDMDNNKPKEQKTKQNNSIFRKISNNFKNWRNNVKQEKQAKKEIVKEVRRINSQNEKQQSRNKMQDVKERIDTNIQSKEQRKNPYVAKAEFDYYIGDTNKDDFQKFMDKLEKERPEDFNDNLEEFKKNLGRQLKNNNMNIKEEEKIQEFQKFMDKLEKERPEDFNDGLEKFKEKLVRQLESNKIESENSEKIYKQTLKMMQERYPEAFQKEKSKKEEHGIYWFPQDPEVVEKNKEREKRAYRLLREKNAELREILKDTPEKRVHWAETERKIQESKESVKRRKAKESIENYKEAK